MKTPKALLLLAPAALAVLVLPRPAFAAETETVQLLDLNQTGASGTAMITATDQGDLHVVIHSKGMTPNSAHAQHIHGATNGMDFHCPDKSADTNHNGFVSTEEGLPMYGDIFISLTTTGATDKASGLAVDRMPMADAQGNLNYDRTIPAAQLPPGTIAHIKDLHIVQHGIDANHNGTYDMAALGESTFAKSNGIPNIPEEATDPATCGMVSGAAAGSMPVGGVNTGDGSTIGHTEPGLIYGVGGAVIAGTLGLSLLRRRKSPRS
jgi:hypothetical protein